MTEATYWKPLNSVVVIGTVISRPVGTVARSGSKLATVLVEVGNDDAHRGNSVHIPVMGVGDNAERVAHLQIGQMLRVEGRLERDVNQDWRVATACRIHARRIIIRDLSAAADSEFVNPEEQETST